MPKEAIKTSKFLSLVLRHKPEAIGITHDAAGWVSVTELLRACNSHGVPLTLSQLQEIVETSDKQRFAFSADENFIRANQGHSVTVNLGYEPRTPPCLLYHGTARKNLSSITRQGLVRGRRHHVHLSPDTETALKVGSRHGAPVVLQIKAHEMHETGHTFYESANGVWLVESVPPEFLILEESASQSRLRALG